MSVVSFTEGDRSRKKTGFIDLPEHKGQALGVDESFFMFENLSGLCRFGRRGPSGGGLRPRRHGSFTDFPAPLMIAGCCFL